ncbi:MAG: M36 family metallopeptidase [Rhodothermales bacterium]
MLQSSLSIALAALLLCAPTQAQQRSASAVTAEEYLQRTAEAYDLAEADLAELVVTDSYVSRNSGTTHVYLRQQVGGIPVVGGEFTVALDREGRAVHAAGRGAVLASQQGLAASPSLSASEAANALALDAGLAPPEAFRTLRSEGGRASVVTLSEAGVAQQPVTAKLVYYLQTSGALALAWEVELEERGAPHYWLGYVDAVGGRVLARHDLVVHDTFGPSPAVNLSNDTAAGYPPSASAVAHWVSPLVELDAHSVGASPRRASESASYRVYAFPLESPLWGTPSPPGDARTLVTDPHDPVASPFGWHDTNGVDGAEFSITRGNNVHAYTDVDGNDVADQGSSPNGDQNGVFVFDFPVSLTQDPSTYRPAAVTNLFYWSNVIHDVMYRYGFDEPAGNFQVNNYVNGGLGGDDVRAEAQDASVLGGGNCNANFSTQGDGLRPRMQMYTCDIASPDSDGDFDNGVIVHEYGHGISNRLTGGPSTSGCLTGDEQMGEGWSDFYGIVFTMDEADTRTTSRPIGNYLIGQTQAGGGIRPAPYNTSFSVNNYTYGDTNGGGLAVPHGIGFVWATALWELTWDLIDAYGFDPDLNNADGGAGNQIAMRLVTDGLKLQPCNPGFINGRDAILMADTMAFGGAHSAIIWQAFARRGLGVSASQGSSGSNADNFEAFDVPLPPPAASVSPSQIYATVAPGDATSEYVTLSNIASPGSGNLNWSAEIANTSSSSVTSRLVRAPLSAVGADRSLGYDPADQPEQRKGQDALAGTGSVNLTGGPDAFGYTFIDSDESGGPAVVFQDIANTGTPVSWTPTGTFPGGDEGFDDIGLPFGFPFYGTERTSVRVFSNGFLTFSSFGSNSFNNASLPNAALPNAVIAPFWDDLDQSAGGAVYTGTLPDGRFVVQYDAVPLFGSPGAKTFQVILASDGTIEFQYEAMAGALAGATVGIENDAGTGALPVVVNSAYVTSNKAVRIVPPPVQFFVSPASGFVAPGDYGFLEVEFVASPSADGIYTADLVLTTNDPDAPSIVVPLELNVTSSLALGVRVMLGGAYDSANGVMRTDLAGGGHLPLAQPFASKGYAGAEIADEGVFEGSEPPVDWVLLHLRATPGGATLASRAALVLGDGSTVDVDGASPVAFVGEPAGAYYLVVETRNHLAVMSASAVDLSGGSASYDFTTALAQAYPGASPAMRQAAPGVWALWPGDFNEDGQVTAPDFNGWSAGTAAGSTGYGAADFNLDGQVTAPDFNLWSASTAAGAETAVPPPGFGPGALPTFEPTGLPTEAGPRGVPALGGADVSAPAPRSTSNQ